MDDLIEQLNQVLNLANLILLSELDAKQAETAGRTDAAMNLILVVREQLVRVRDGSQGRLHGKTLDQYSQIMVEIFDQLGGVMAERTRRVIREEGENSDRNHA
jgi:hypothetical protein